MQPREFLYFLIDKDGNSYEVNPNDTLELNATPTPLPESPDAWQETEVRYARNPSYRGIFRSFSTPLKFVKAGARILRELFYKNYVELSIRLSILRLNTDTYVHDPFFTGELDFVNMADNERYVELNIMDGGATKFLKANENTVYEIDVDANPEAINIYMDGVDLYDKGNFIAAQSDITYGIYMPPIPLINKEGQNVGVNMPGQALTDLFDDTITTQDKYLNNYLFMYGTKDITVRVKGVLKYKCRQNTVNGKLKIAFATVDQNNGDFTDYVLYNPGTVEAVSDPFIPNTLSFDLTINVPAGHPLILYAMHYNIPRGRNLPGFVIMYSELTKFSIEFVTKFEPTTIKALKPMTLLKALVDKMSNGTCTVESSIFSADDTVKVTSGDAIRRFSGSVIKTSLADFMKSYRVPYSIGMGMKDSTTFVVERLPYFYDKTTEIANLEDVTQFKLEVNKDEVYNRMKIGWPDQTYEDVNGRNEFNITHGYTFPITKVNKELDLTSVYRADMYGIEYTRINFEGRTTTDSKSDNSVFLIKTEKNPRTGILYYLDRSMNSNVSGILTPTTAFNVGLSPKRCLLANREFISSLFANMYSGLLTFQTSGKPAVMRSFFGSNDGDLGYATEGDDVGLAMFQSPLYKPYVMSFTCPMPYLLVDLMQATPNGYFSFTWNGGSYKGFLIDGGMKPGTMKEQDVRMLVTPDTDLNQLIN